jgi:hypothetical protein
MAFRLRPGSGPEQRAPRIIDKDHKGFIAKLPCLITGANRVEVAHIRYGEPDLGKPSTGMQQKPSDKWTVPLAPHVHREGPEAQHGSGERDWWTSKGVDPLKVAEALYRVSGDLEAGRAICRNARLGEFK